MNSPFMMSNYAHAGDVLSFAETCLSNGERCALAAVIDTDGGGVRAPGALMCVSESGRQAGYVSNGCVDADVVMNAKEAIAQNTSRRIVYGRGSPFLDVKLPCGGRIELLIIANPDVAAIRSAVATLAKREPVCLTLSESGLSISSTAYEATAWRGDVLGLTLVPKPRLRIAGRGAEPVALARLANASDMATLVQSPDESSLSLARSMGLPAMALSVPDHPPSIHDDPWTAFVLMFHDHDWEPGLLEQALAGSAFYIGALGSRKTHDLRCETLRDRGMDEASIRRIRGPIGLIKQSRDASLLAVSTLAEIAEAYQELNP